MLSCIRTNVPPFRKAREALENFWTLSCREKNRKVDFHFLTTSLVAKERDGDFGDAKGIELWSAAQTNPDLAIKVAEYLVKRLDASAGKGGRRF